MVEFHIKAKESFAAHAEEIKQEVKAYALVNPRNSSFEIHPSDVINASDIIGIPQITDREVDGTGTETGRFWMSGGHRVGWKGNSFQKIKQLAQRMNDSKELRDLVSESFVLDQVFFWLCESLDGKCSLSLGDYVETRCNEAITDHEIYIPLWRTYSTSDFEIGTVRFKSITKEFLNGWFLRELPKDEETRARINQLEKDTRIKFQATLAACVLVRGEKKKADQIALQRAIDASALLRFLCLSNWTSKVKCFTQPWGMENTQRWHGFHLENGQIKSLSSNGIAEGSTEWAIDEAVGLFPGLIEILSDLANSQKSPFRKSLLDSFYIYSRNSITTNPSDKLVFILVALESLLVRDSSEPIQGNLAERIAFLVGTTLDERKRIVSTVRKIYGMRSKFVHHGQGLSDSDIFNEFLGIAWSCLFALLKRRDEFNECGDLIAKLDELKLS